MVSPFSQILHFSSCNYCSDGLFWVCVLLKLHWLKRNICKHFSIHSDRFKILLKLIPLKSYVILAEHDSKRKQGCCEVFWTQTDQVPIQVVEYSSLAPCHLFPTKICFAWNSSKVSNEGNVVVNFIILWSEHQQCYSVKINLFNDFLVASSLKQSVQKYDSNLKCNASLFEPVSNVENPFNKSFSQLW